MAAKAHGDHTLNPSTVSIHLHKDDTAADIKASQALTLNNFITSSIVRFGLLKEYIQEKLSVDYFAIEGNLGIARGIHFYLNNQKERLAKLDQIKVLDIGPAIGALTALLVLQELGKLGLLAKARLILVDVSERVLDHTQQRDFQFPDLLIDKKFKKPILSKLRLSKGILASAHELSLKANSIDICTAGFLFHNLHDHIKKPAAAEIQRVVKPGGFIGIADKWFDNYEEYARAHAQDDIPLAHESIISYRSLRRLFPHIEVFDTHNPIRRGKPRRRDGTKKNDNYYYFCGMKRGESKPN